MRKSKISISERYQTFELTPIKRNEDSQSKSVKIQFYTFNGISKEDQALYQQRWPKFNLDGLYYTPAFIIPEDIRVLSIVKDNLKDQHMKNMKVNQEPSTSFEMSSILMPKQGGEHYCGVCKTGYFHFQSHITSLLHKSNCSSSNYTKYINDFVEQFFPTKSSQPVVNSQLKQISESTNNQKTQQQNNENVYQFQSFYEFRFSEQKFLSNELNIQETPLVKRRRLQ